MEIAKIEKQKRRALTRKLFVCRENNSKIEKAFVRNLENFSYGVNDTGAAAVTGGNYIVYNIDSIFNILFCNY